jgi:hypothetical protein
MRWSEPQIGDVRIVRRFLWWPMSLNGQTRWLERATVRQVYERQVDGSEFWRWVDFVDGDSSPVPAAQPSPDEQRLPPRAEVFGTDNHADADADAPAHDPYEFLGAVKTSRALRDQSTVDMLVGMGEQAIPILIRAALSDLDAVHPVLVRISADLAVPKLIDELRHPDRSIRRMAAVLLAYPYLKPQVTTAIPALFDASRDDDPAVRCAAIRALAAIAEPTAASRMLADSLLDEDMQTRRTAAVLLGQLGDAARHAVPALSEAMNDANPEVREAAAYAIEQIRGTAAKL